MWLLLWHWRDPQCIFSSQLTPHWISDCSDIKHLLCVHLVSLANDWESDHRKLPCSAFMPVHVAKTQFLGKFKMLWPRACPATEHRDMLIQASEKQSASETSQRFVRDNPVLQHADCRNWAFVGMTGTLLKPKLDSVVTIATVLDNDSLAASNDQQTIDPSTSTRSKPSCFSRTKVRYMNDDGSVAMRFCSCTLQAYRSPPWPPFRVSAEKAKRMFLCVYVVVFVICLCMCCCCFNHYYY